MREPDRFIDPSTPPEVLGLRGGVDAPDLSDSILGEVERRRGWLSLRQRRLVCAARWAGGFALLATFAGVLLVQRATPIDEAIAPQERPLADLMRSFRDEASIAVQTVSTQMRALPEQLVSQSHQMVTGRIERRGAQRIVELDGPVSVIEEGTLGRKVLGDWSVRDNAGVLSVPQHAHSGAPVTIEWRDGRYRTIHGNSWSFTVPPDWEAARPEAERLENERR